MQLRHKGWKTLLPVQLAIFKLIVVFHLIMYLMLMVPNFYDLLSLLTLCAGLDGFMFFFALVTLLSLWSYRATFISILCFCWCVCWASLLMTDLMLYLTMISNNHIETIKPSRFHGYPLSKPCCHHMCVCLCRTALPVINECASCV